MNRFCGREQLFSEEVRAGFKPLRNRNGLTTEGLHDFDQRGALGDDFADHARGDVAALERG